MRRLFMGLAAALAVGLAAGPVIAAPLKVLEHGSALQARTDRFVLRSEGVDHDFLVEVTAPATTLKPGERLPVILALDGGYDVVGPIAHVLQEGRAMAPAFVVAVGYPSPFGISAGPREIDMAHDKRPAGRGGPLIGGGGAAFEAFLMDELKPFLAARYPIDPAATVVIGHSQGAYFASHILTERPETFQAYVLGGAPVIMQPTLEARIKAMAAKGAGRRVFVGYSPEDVAAFKSDRLGAALAAEGSAFQVRQKLFEGQTHLSSYAALVAEALPFVLRPPARTPPAALPPVALDAAALSQLAGVYRFRRGIEAEFVQADGRLSALYFGRRFDLVPTGERAFAIPGVDAVLTFAPARGPARSVTLSEDGTSDTAVRVKAASTPPSS
jgi:predicted alpha/beta superfamily hydrolase